MIIPTRRLLRWFAILAMPLSLLVVLDDGWLGISLAGLAITLAAAAVDAAAAVGRLAGFRLELPPVVRATQGRESSLPIRIHRTTGRTQRLRLAIAFPAGVSPVPAEHVLRLPADATTVRIHQTFKTAERGRSTVTQARLGTPSPLGLWEWWRLVDARAEIRSYPNLMTERRALASVFLNRGGAGIHAQRQLGRGREFEKLREYAPGDSFQEIHWKATAKRGHPMTKVFQLERTQEVYVVIDCSRLSGRPLTRAAEADSDAESRAAEPALERFLTAALALGQVAEHQGDLFGLTVFSDRVERFVRARTGTAHFHACRDALYQVEAREVSPDYEELATFLRLRLRRRALLLYLTSLDDPILAESFVQHAQLLSRQHLMLVCMPRPAGMHPVFEDGDVSNTDQMYDRLAGHLQWQKLRETTGVLRRLGVELHLVDHAALSLELLRRYVSVKQRQQL
jgi:uncharacterized protein (DUF58 family)